MSPDPLPPPQRFLVALARALHEAGAPAHRLEDTVDHCSRALNIQFDCLSQPTSLILGFGEHTRVLRVQPNEMNLERLVEIDEVGTRVARGLYDPVQGLDRLRAISAMPPRYPAGLVVLAGAISSGTSAVFLHASVGTTLIATALGFVVGCLAQISRLHPGYSRLHELIASFVVAATATAVARLLPIPIPVLTLAGIISLLPGLTLTVALTELATKHLASGTARFAGAVVTFLQLALGTALGWKVAELLPKAVKTTTTVLPDWAAWAMLPIAAGAFTIAFKARPRDYVAILAVSFLGYAAALQGQLALGAELGASVGGLVVGLASNLQARVRKVPTALTQVPGLLLLVPGSIGFRGFGAMLEDDVSTGIGAVFSMVVIAASLVAGILAAGVLLPPRKSL